jgi:GNAT superfamily N-acetyltransferase
VVHIAPLTEQSEQATPSGPHHTREQVVELLARSFYRQPHFVDLFPDPQVRARALPAVFAALCRDARRHGRIDLATCDGELAGVAVWYPPWSYPLSTSRKLLALPDIVRLALAARRRLPRVLQFQSTAATLHPDPPYWYLAAVGVDPTMQGAEVGTQLLESGLAEADATGHACYLETHPPRLVSWYQRLGFGIRHGEVAFAPGGPPNWTMLRTGSSPSRASGPGAERP